MTPEEKDQIVKEYQLLALAMNNIILCAQFIENMVQERHFLFGDGGPEPKGILHIDQ